MNQKAAPPPSSLSLALTSQYRPTYTPNLSQKMLSFRSLKKTLPHHLTHHDDPKPRRPDAIEPQEGRPRSLGQLQKPRIGLLRRACRRGPEPLGPGSGGDDRLAVDDEGGAGRVDRHVDGGASVAETEGGGVDGPVEGGV